MELFRTQPSLCSLFLRQLEDWGAETLDWSLLRDEDFVDRFLRRLKTSCEIEPEAVYRACACLIQPSVGGLLVAPILHQGGHFDLAGLENFVGFTLQGKAAAWDPMSWPELLTVLEEVVFFRQGDPFVLLALLFANGWVSEPLRERCRKRVWETCRLPLVQKRQFELWLRGGLSIPGVDPAPAQNWACKPVGRSQDGFARIRPGFSLRGKEAHG